MGEFSCEDLTHLDHSNLLEAYQRTSDKNDLDNAKAFSKSWKRESDLKVSSCILYILMQKKQTLPTVSAKVCIRILWKQQVCDGYGYTLQITYKDGKEE